MAGLINIQDMVSSIYNTVMQLNQDAINLIGLDCLWCRLLPYSNGEDVIVQEYTLHSYDCPKTIQIISNKTDYSLGNYSIDMFGIHQEIPLEVSVDVNAWEAVYGKATMPQKGDFVFIKMFNRPFEVLSSTCVYSLTNLVTSFKCQLGEWKHAASRLESEDFTSSIDAITDSQDRLFGTAISEEVADTVIAAETSYLGTTYADTLKEFDMGSVITDDIPGPNGNIISHAYYDFSKASSNVIYNNGAVFDPESEKKHWIFSTWLSIDSTDIMKTANLSIKSLKAKERDYWLFTIETSLELKDGDEITAYRGGSVKVTGNIQKTCNDCAMIMRIPSSQCFAASKKIAKWWESGTKAWKIAKSNVYNLITGYDSDGCPLKIDIYGNNLIADIAGQRKQLQISSKVKDLDFCDWHYIALDISADNLRMVVVKDIANTGIPDYEEQLLADITEPINIKSFSCDKFSIENSGNSIRQANIRLYENEYSMDDTYKIDMYSIVTRNASKLLVIDGPKPANENSFITSIR